MSTDADSEKPHPPSPRRLQELRQKGEIAKSNDLITAAAYFGFLVALWAMPPFAGIADALRPFLSQPDRMAGQLLTARGSDAFTAQVSASAAGLAPVLLLPGVFALLGVFGQNALVMAPQKLAPKMSRVSPVKGFQNKFGLAGLFEFAKSSLKLVLYSALLSAVLLSDLDVIIGSALLEPSGGVITLQTTTLRFLGATVVLMIAIGAVDALFQHHNHLRKNRMSHQELKDDHKASEGDPFAKQQRRQRGMEIASRQMLADVAKADVVLVNPTHYAVALGWDRSKPEAPRVLAKGVDHIALRIREVAQSAGVPVRSDPPTARAIYATSEIGDQIDRQHFRQVAAAIRFADRMRQRVRTGRSMNARDLSKLAKMLELQLEVARQASRDLQTSARYEADRLEALKHQPEASAFVAFRAAQPGLSQVQASQSERVSSAQLQARKAAEAAARAAAQHSLVTDLAAREKRSAETTRTRSQLERQDPTARPGARYRGSERR